jgi:hypothetical protein
VSYFVWPIGMNPADHVEYMQLLGVQVAVPAPWVGDGNFCQQVDVASGAICTLDVGHDDAHRDLSDPQLVMSWKEPVALLLGFDDE